MPRLFTAVEIPEEIGDRLTDLSQPLPGAKWVGPDDYHITLRFAGDIEGRIERDFVDMLSAVEGDVLELRLEGLGTFGGSDPRSIWAGVAGPGLERLEALARANERAARSAGLPPEPHKFKPHVTLARLRGTPVDLLARYLQRQGAFRTPSFIVSRFVLMSSRPRVGGGPYVVEAVFPLGGASLGEEDEQGWKSWR